MDLLPKLQLLVSSYYNPAVPVYHPEEGLAEQRSKFQPQPQTQPLSQAQTQTQTQFQSQFQTRSMMCLQEALCAGSEMPTPGLFKWKSQICIQRRVRSVVPACVRRLWPGPSSGNGCCHSGCLECKWLKASAETKHGRRSNFYYKAR